MTSKSEVTIRGTEDSRQLPAKRDTGADRTAIDCRIAAAVGAGPVILSVKTHQSSGVERRPVVPIWVEVDGQVERLKVGLSDREEMSTDVLLGQDIIETLEDRSLTP
jgi:hypothetical protein